MQNWLATADVAEIDETVQARLAQALAPISAHYLRRLLLASGAPLSPLVEGVRQDSLDQAERTLCALAALYPESPRQTRALVIEAKDHARLALSRLQDTAARVERQELIDWMVVWVNDPEIFPTWVRLRRQAIESRSTPPE